jgi:hypothetical protein
LNDDAAIVIRREMGRIVGVVGVEGDARAFIGRGVTWERMWQLAD